MADRACVVVVSDGQLLLLRQTYRGQTLWTFPGGTVELNETPEAAAVRETLEETGLHVELLRSLGQAERTTGNGTYYCFLARIIDGIARLGHDPELPSDAQDLHELCWFPLCEVRRHPEVARVWNALAEVLPIAEDGDKLSDGD